MNNAGVEGPLCRITDLEEDDWDRVIDTNLKGTYLCLKHEARATLEGGRDDASYITGSALTADGGFTLSA